MTAFARTEVVYLKSGGPAMTVKEVIEVKDPKMGDRGPLLECTWFEGKTLRNKLFFSDLVTHADPKKPAGVQSFVPPMPNETERDRA